MLMDPETLVKNVPSIKSKFLELIHKHEAFKFGEFTLKSGLKSNVFFNSAILTDSESFDLMTDLLVAKLIESNVEFDALMGCPYKAIPLVSTICVKYYKLKGMNVNFGYYRKEEKTHGEGKLFVGSPKVFEENSRIVVVDDVLAMGISVSHIISLISKTKAKVVCVLVLLNRETNYGEFRAKLKEMNIELLEVLKQDELIDPNKILVWS